MDLGSLIILIGLIWLLIRLASRSSRSKTTGQLAAREDDSVPEQRAARERWIQDQRTSSWQLPPSRVYATGRMSQAEALKKERECWVIPKRVVSIQGYSIGSGLIYVGSGLPSVGGLRQVEPALIDPSLPIQKQDIDRAGANVPYWCSYSEIPLGSRTAYLEWLAGDRKDSQTSIGYVFLFFYGLERRLLSELHRLSPDNPELIVIAAEVQRLLEIHGDNASFRNYATNFLDLLSLGARTETLIKEPPSRSRNGVDLPIQVNLVLSHFASTEQPLPADWALSWVLCHPETRLRTPARRCSGELRKLFRIRYAQRCGDSLVVKPGKGKLIVRYRPASPTFGSGELTIPTEFPDTSASRKLPKRLLDLVESCTDELEPYSRWIGTKSDSDNPLAAVALLPAELAESHQGKGITDLTCWVEDQLGTKFMVSAEAKQLLNLWGSLGVRSLPKSDAVLLGQLLEKKKYGMEPDVRFGGPAISQEGKVVLFRLQETPDKAPSQAYVASMVLLYLGTMVAQADRTVTTDEKQYLERHLVSALHLSESEKCRLRAHLHWLLEERRGTSGLKKRLSVLEQNQRLAIGQYLVTVAGADGHIGPEEIETLTKLYPLLGLDKDNVFRDVHSLSVEDAVPAEVPPLVRPAEEQIGRFRIPRPIEQGIKGSEFTLDMKKVESKLSEAATVSALLGSIFIDEEAKPALKEIIPSASKTIGNLNDSQSALLKALVTKETWRREELEALASDLGVLLDGSLDAINESAYEILDQPLWEGDDPIMIDLKVGQEFLA